MNWSQARIRVLIADDHPIVRAGIAATIDTAADMLIVGTAIDGADAVRLAIELEPDVMLTDLRMPVLDGVDATSQVRAAIPTTRVIVLTTYEEDDAILRAISAGASGYLLKAAPEREILAGIRSVAAGGTVLAPSIAAALARGVQHRRTAPQLTDRETEVLALIATGSSNPEVGRRLHIGEATVKTHLQHAFEKLGVNDRTHAVILATQLGMLPRDR